MFKEYVGKPVVRKAFEITTPVTKCTDEESTYLCNGVKFKAYEEPKQGDFVVRLTEDALHQRCVS